MPQAGDHLPLFLSLVCEGFNDFRELLATVHSRALGFVMQAHSADSNFAPEFPRTMSWSAYNLGTTGYNQAVGIGKALKDNYNVNLRVLPGKNDVSRLLPLQRGRVQFSANGVATYFGQEVYFNLPARPGGQCDCDCYGIPRRQQPSTGGSERLGH